MHTAAKLAGYVLGLAAVFAGAVAIGAATGPSVAAVGPSATDPAGAADSHAGGVDAAHPNAGEAHAAEEMSTPMAMPTAAEPPGGLMVSQDGYTLALAERSMPSGPAVPLRFQILGPDGDPVTGYQRKHDKDLHLIVVRRDLSGFQHLHPTLASDGTWTVPVNLSAAGQYRVFADFTPIGHGGLTLGADLAVSGLYQPVPLPAANASAELSDGYRVSLDGGLVAGQDSELILRVSKDGVPVTDLQPYLAAYGHLVALRVGDLAYLHVHPAGHPGDGVTPAGPDITFDATVPSAGDYRLFLDFQHNGVVRTAEFTVSAGETGAAAGTAAAVPEAAVPDAAGTDGHGH
jgi:hypothetical protein